MGLFNPFVFFVDKIPETSSGNGSVAILTPISFAIEQTSIGNVASSILPYNFNASLL
jgi:hypothetical protein